MRPAVRRTLLAGLALALAGCASWRAPVPQDPSEALSGRLSVRVDAREGTPARSLSASFELIGDPRTGRLNLSSPLGAMLAQARWAPQGVVLATPEGETAYADLDDLTREMLGEALPLAAFFDWLRGRPWPGAQSRPAEAGTPAGFAQLGWSVDLGRYEQGWVLARRAQAPAVTVRALLDRP